jgi:hypothetical protein
VIGVAGVLVVLGLAMFVAGLATGATAFFWGCVGVCVVAAVLLVIARRHIAAAPEAGPDEDTALPATEVVAAVTTESAATRTRRPPPESLRRTDELPAVPPASRPPEEPPTAVAPAVETSAPATGGYETPVDETPVHESRYYQRLSAEQPAEPAPLSGPSTGATAASAGQPPTAAAMPAVGPGEPPMEDVEVTDLLIIVDLKDEVLVVDEHPRYHLPGCPAVAGQETIPLPLDEARTDGFTPCGICTPDSTLAERERTRRGR